MQHHPRWLRKSKGLARPVCPAPAQGSSHIYLWNDRKGMGKVKGMYPGQENVPPEFAGVRHGRLTLTRKSLLHTNLTTRPRPKDRDQSRPGEHQTCPLVQNLAILGFPERFLVLWQSGEFRSQGRS